MKVKQITEQEKSSLDFLASRGSRGWTEPFTEEEIDRYLRVHHKVKINKNLKRAANYYNRVVSGYTNESIHMI